jgi:uncharacterized membrane protein HdeD (DUF308 family)
MLDLLGRNWWLILLRGAAAVLFGLAALLLPEVTLVTLVILFGVYVLIDGVFSVAAALREKGRRTDWWVVLVEGLVGLIIGAAVLAWPGITALVLIYLAAGWAAATGILELVAAVFLRKEIQGEWFLALSGLASLAIGVILFLQPGAGMVVVSWLIGVYAVVFGLLLIVLSLRLRSRIRDLESGGELSP